MSKRMRVATVALACAFAIAVSGPIMAWAALATNYDWYKGHESDASFTIETAGQLDALAKLVNGTASYDRDGDGKADSIEAVSFEGKAIKVDSASPIKVLGFLGGAITPIGTQEHPFQGVFDGNGWEVANFKLSVAAADAGPVSNVGVFGYVGPRGSVSNLKVASSSSISIVRSASSTDYVTNVGMVVGYCAGTVTNCSNAGALSIASEVVQQSASDYLTVRNVGGVVGQCVYDVTGCLNTGTVTISQMSSPVASIEHAQLVARVGGVVGLLGDEERVGTYDKHVYGEASKHGDVRDCVNEGKVSIDTPKLSGLDRFGQQTNAESVAVGGVVGYSQGSVVNCTNGLEKSALADDAYQDKGYVRAENGVMVGGVCGSLRGVLADNMNIAWADDGADGNDPIALSGCTNYGDVYGRVTVGGIVGKASSYTTVTECVNACKKKQTAPGVYASVETFVIATRWNKPAPGGIVGTANGEVSYCANFATVASGTWKDEASRTMNTQDGYYAAGIAGMLTYFDDQAASHGGITTPISEVFSCYNAGAIIAGSNMRQRGITGQNDGFTHDNVLLKGVVDADEMVYGDSADEPEASGTVGENRVYSAAELRGEKAVEAVAFLNGNSEANGWQRYWMVPRDATASGLNEGFPLLDMQDPWGDDATSLAAAEAALSKDAPYTGGESVPQVTAKLGGATLVQNADFRVVPESGATETSTGAPYKATLVGLGRYKGEATAKVAYDITASSFSACTVTVVAHTFDYEAYVPKADEVTVRTPAGTTVDSSEYAYSIVDENGAEIQPVNADTYRIVVSPTAQGLKHFSGTLEGAYRIKPASFMREVKFDETTIEYLGQSYPWVDSKEKGEADNPKTTLPYTGVAVKPAVGSIKYKGHTLVEGTDYRIVYGNSNSDDGYTGDQDANNMGKKGGTSIGCITIRYISGGKTNFTSYSNMFFNISDDGSRVDLSKARAVVEGDQISDGNALEPVELWLGNTKLVEGADYAIAYKNNVYPGTASFTATGKGMFDGTLKGSFEIIEGSVYEFSYTYAGTGAKDSPFEATVTGVNYLSSRDSFDMTIPSAVEHDGHEYAVVAIADKAFGGSGADFTGSDENASKAKIASVFIPATVRTIGRFAFGTNDITMTSPPPVASVEFAGGSQLVSIGDYAFSRCDNLKSITVPAGVREIGVNAFQSRGNGYGLEEIRFLTTSAAMPQTVASTAFRYCVGVTVRGHDAATAVKAIASGNASSQQSGANGGRGFTFKAFAAAPGLSVADIPGQVYSGAAMKPAVKVSVSGGTLREGTDFNVSYANNVNAGSATATVTGIGEYGFVVTKSFNIAPCPISKAEFMPVADQRYSGAAVSLSARLSLGAMTLKEGIDYTLSYANAGGAAISAPSAAGSYRLVATGKGNFTGSRYRAFRIVTASLENAEVTLGDQGYTGVAVEPDPNVKFGGAVLERDRDYSLTFAANVDVGQASVTVHGMGGFSGEKTVGFRIVQSSLADAQIAGVSDVWVNDAVSGASFDPVVIDDGVRLRAGVDYDVSYEKVASPGGASPDGAGGIGSASAGFVAASAADGEADGPDAPASAGSTGAGALVASGTVGGSAAGASAGSLAAAGFSPRSHSPAASMAASPIGTQELEPGEALESAPTEVGEYYLVISGKGTSYRGTARFPFSITAEKPASPTDLSDAEVSVASARYNGGYCRPGVEVKLDDTIVNEDSYIVAYEDNVSVGTGSATVYGTGSYCGSARASFEVKRAQIADEHVKDIAAVPYAGGAAEPKVGIVVEGRSLVEGTDYTVSYSGNDKPGTATARVQGVGGYEGAVSKPFEISSIDISGATVTADSAVYTGSAVEPAVKVLLDGSELSKGVDYTVSFSNNTVVGNASFTVVGKGVYSGSVTGSFRITPRSLSGAEVSAGDVTYTGAPQEPAVVVELNGKTLAKGVDYTVSYSNNVQVGTASIVVSGQGNYGGTVQGAFKIKAAPVVPEAAPAPAPSVPAPEASASAASTSTLIAVGSTIDGVSLGGASKGTVKVTGSGEVRLIKATVKSGGSVTVNKVIIGGAAFKVTAIGDSAFAGTSAKAVTIGANVTKVGKNAFKGAKKLKKVTVGKSVKTIGKNAFKGCKNLKKVTLKASKLTKSSFKNMVKGSKIKTVKLSGVSKKAKKNYKKWAKALGITVK